MIAGIVALVDVDELRAGEVWHLADVACYPLATFCGSPTPDPMRRRVRPARQLPVDDVCPTCVDVWGASDGGRQLRQSC